MPDVKMKDIAEALGVSVVTVSNALAGRRGVSAEVREAVERTAREMGYQSSGRSRGSRSAVIGVIVSEKYISVGVSFYWSLYQHLAYEASRMQGVTMLEILSLETEELGELPRQVREKSIDGLIVVGWMSRAYVEMVAEAAGVPVVLLDFHLRGIICDCVLSANYIGMYKMTRYLIEKGHRDIAFLGSTRENENIMDRYYGYRKALIEAGIRLRKEWVLEDRDLKTGLPGIQIPENMPTAFACNSDWAAGLLYDELRARGYRIPENISIVGYDDYLYGNSFAEQLTTYHVDMKKMAALAVKILHEKISGKEKFWGTRYVDGEIVERGSVKPLI